MGEGALLSRIFLLIRRIFTERLSQPKPNAESVLRFGVFAPDVHKRYGSISGLRGESGLRVDCVHYRPRDFVFGCGATVVKPFDGDVEKHSRIKVRRVFVGVGIIAGKGGGKIFVEVVEIQGY